MLQRPWRLLSSVPLKRSEHPPLSSLLSLLIQTNCCTLDICLFTWSDLLCEGQVGHTVLTSGGYNSVVVSPSSVCSHIKVAVIISLQGSIFFFISHCNYDAATLDALVNILTPTTTSANHGWPQANLEYCLTLRNVWFLYLKRPHSRLS